MTSDTPGERATKKKKKKRSNFKGRHFRAKACHGNGNKSFWGITSQGKPEDDCELAEKISARTRLGDLSWQFVKGKK